MVSVVIGVIVGGVAAQEFVQGWLINRGNLLAFLTESPFSIVLITLILLSIVISVTRDVQIKDE